MDSKHGQLRQVAVVHSLRSCQLFAGLPMGDLETIATFTTVKSLARGETLFREGNPSRGFYIVQRGALSVSRVNAAGKEQIIHIFREGESLAEASLATDTGYPASGRAVESTQVLLIQKAGFLSLIQCRPELALRMLGSMSVHLRVLVGQLEDLTLKDFETRLAHWLVKHCPQPDHPSPVAIELKMTKRMLAAELGTVSETFSRTLARFRERGLITVKGRLITVCSPPRLALLLRKNLGE